MTQRWLRWIAFILALAINGAAIVVYGIITDWCFCAICGVPEPPVPPPYMIRFLEFAVFPAGLVTNGPGADIILIVGAAVWFVMILALLNVMAFVARIRVRARRDDARGRWIGLAPAGAVRAAHMLLLAGVLLAAGLAAGARARRAWLADAERVFRTTMDAAASSPRLPAGVEFRMYDWVGDEMVDVIPASGYTVQVDPRVAGNHFPDRFVTPMSYGGTVRFISGKRYTFSVYRRDGDLLGDGPGWTVSLDPPRRRPREYW
ncbi:hypothetical protein [Longimicrobium terrae]|uniref:Uncharacterized protein n=1 Tax=Longimicrobium terrae TaxID=1639882 RepID=A0A841GJC5_9BACT|nr:hypothetical protein [Longimicrobium terrae]MBB4634329.1 hypothetical protein [Longimicrobium terrae]MBB6068781.1 hypothetical protein [Longimicrobium terrae]NNC27965.1 hypothetical protein [Longimicrobium terrae]